MTTEEHGGRWKLCYRAYLVFYLAPKCSLNGLATTKSLPQPAGCGVHRAAIRWKLGNIWEGGGCCAVPCGASQAPAASLCTAYQSPMSLLGLGFPPGGSFVWKVISSREHCAHQCSHILVSSVAGCGIERWGLVCGGSMLLWPGGVILVSSLSPLLMLPGGIGREAFCYHAPVPWVCPGASCVWTGVPGTSVPNKPLFVYTAGILSFVPVLGR